MLWDKLKEFWNFIKPDNQNLIWIAGVMFLLVLISIIF